MKCINCGTANSKKELLSKEGRCKNINCQQPFVFLNTKISGKEITDEMFVKAVKAISINDTVFFSHKQLFWFLEKQWRKKVLTRKKLRESTFFKSLNLLLSGIIIAAIIAGSKNYFREVTKIAKLK